MHTLTQLEKQQVGLRLPRYLIEEIDQFTETFSINRTDIITEALRAYIASQKEKIYYDGFRQGACELKEALNGSAHQAQTLDGLIDELDDH